MRETTISTPSSTGSAPPEQPEPGAARDPRARPPVAGAHDGLHLLRRIGQHRGRRRHGLLEQARPTRRAQLVLVGM
jgi:hypothetical protein